LVERADVFAPKGRGRNSRGREPTEWNAQKPKPQRGDTASLVSPLRGWVMGGESTPGSGCASTRGYSCLGPSALKKQKRSSERRVSPDREARHLGVPRQSLIKMLIARHLEKETA
jgi:hypothetical protein